MLAGSATALPAAEPLPRSTEKTKGLERRAGLLDLYVDAERGAVWLRLPPPGSGGEVGRYLYYEGLVSGLGSNPVGLDRSQLGETRLVALRRLGGRVLVEQLNTRYRALSDAAAERAATAQSFATSVLWAGEIAAADPDGSVLVDFTSFVLRDAHGIVRSLETSGQGTWTLDEKRSALDPALCLAFPENMAFEALLTFQCAKPGPEVRATAPSPDAISLVLRHVLLKLPEPGYAPRRFDPRVGVFAVTFADYATPLAEPLDKRWIVRHRLEKVDPGAARSPVRRPIVYYVDRGAPEPVRSALLDGARWWAQAFDAAGFVAAFRVELLPEDAHPLDVRYNVINWVHRATRGGSNGDAIMDPRTGEIIKGHVLLGSLRVRQDRLLFEGLAGTARTGSGSPDDPIQLALARIRQLSAHVVGHTLGLAHNFAASTYGRASVMDYPAPLVQVTPAGELDFTRAYGVGAGAWDLHCIRYAYAQFAPGTDEAAALEAIVQEGLQRGLQFVSDEDARPAGAAQPLGNLWDNGELAETELLHLAGVRRVALASFGARNIMSGQPLAALEEVFAPVYLMHRYQVDAAAKVLGGVDYRYALRGDADAEQRFIAASRQRQALEALLACLAPEFLDIPDAALAVLLPRPFGYEHNREQFASAAGPTFDALGAAASAADLVLRALFQPERCLRLVDQNRRDSSLPGLEAVLERVRDTLFTSAALPPRQAELRRVVQRVAVEAWIALAAAEATPAPVRARIDWHLEELRDALAGRGGDNADKAHRALLRADLTRHLTRVATATAAAPAAALPPGSPIGLAGCSWEP